MEFVTKKLYYKIGEVCDIVGVQPHVLRYWETEFPRLSPPKNKAGQRTYRPKDIELLLEIRKLLYDEGYTIAGARKHLSAAARVAAVDPPPEKPAPDANPRRERANRPEAPAQDIRKVRKELENILTLLNRG